MANSPELTRIDYSVCDTADADAMANLLGEVFSRRDPPAYAVGLTATEFERFVLLFCPKAVAEGLTLIARSRDNGALVGALLTEDCASPMPEGLDRLSHKFEPVFDILGQLSTEYWGDRQPRPGESIHLFLLGVAESVVGCGVAQQLVTACLQLGASKGYRLAVTEATNKVSQHIFRKLGFVERARRSYETHRFDGRAVFETIAAHGGPILMDRSLASD